jgi:hypothetical protein
MIEYTVKVDANGNKNWLLNGKLHREDGPAIEDASGNKFWWLNGERHREDGPAIEWADGDKEWYLNDEELTEAEFNNRMIKSCIGKLVDIEGVKYKLVEVSNET